MTASNLKWTPPAREGLDRYFALKLSPAELDGADPQELRADLQAHMEEEMARAGVHLVTLEDLRLALARMGETLPPPHKSPLPGATEIPSLPSPAPGAFLTSPGVPAPAAAAGPDEISTPSYPPPASTPPPTLTPALATATDAPPTQTPPPSAPPPAPAAPENPDWKCGAKKPWWYAPPPVSCKKPPIKGRHGVRHLTTYFVLGFLLPLFVFLFELCTRGSADVLFDPMPDLWHHLLVLTVPLAGWSFWRSARGKTSPRMERALPWLVGLALPAALWYAICYLPVAPIAVIGIIWFGIGLLPLSPLLATIILARARVQLLRHPAEGTARGLKWGFRLGVLAVLLVETPALITRVAVHRASDTGADAEVWASAARMVRRFGSESALLRICYQEKSPAGWVSSWINLASGSGESPWDESLTVSRDLYFRVTGTPFNDARPPFVWRPILGQPFAQGSRRRIDEARGGTEVAGRVTGLSLGDSRMDWHCEEASGLTWGEWTLTFQNATARPEEARCRIALPPGGFVSRVTLWVDGKPEEAAFSTVAKVRAAYQAVAVVERRDPVLVTQPDAGTILLQAFPVPARGQLKTRITITVPAGTGDRVWLPSLVERNFELPDSGTQPLWIQADRGTLALSADLHAQAAMEGTSPTLTAGLPWSKLSGNGTAFTWTHRSAPLVFCEDPLAPAESKIVVAKAGAPEVIQPGAIAWVIDSSGPLAAWKAAMTAAVKTLSPAGQSAVFLPGDTAAELKVLTNPDDFSPSFAGGRDNAPALAAALDWLRGKPSGCLIWLHGPQPGGPDARVSLEQILDRSPASPLLLDLPLIPGQNNFSRLLANAPRLRTLAVRHEGQDLAASIRAALTQRAPEFSVLPAGTAPPEGAVKTSDSLARWYARREAARLSLTNPAAASALAASHQIVSPWSGAVVLERASDYTKNGLTQSNAAVSQQVPVIPEPSGVALLLLSATHLLLRRRRPGRTTGNAF